MLEIKKSAVSFDENDLMELERIVTDGDEKEALRFVKSPFMLGFYMPSRAGSSRTWIPPIL